ncbi:12082_t:CDS:2, partial [Racocetra fulgida]
TNVGKLLMQQCSSTLKKISLELGGNAPFIAFDDANVEAAVEVSGFKVGSGFDPQTTHGPLINAKAVDKVTRHIEDAVAKGAEILVGGVRRNGNYFDPTVLTGMSADMIVTNEETFGPVAALYKFDKDEEVIKLANNSQMLADVGK